jgi:hypothetical protein
VFYHRDLFWWRQHPNQEIKKAGDKYIELNYKIHKDRLSELKNENLKKTLLKNIDILFARRLVKLLLKLKLKYFLYLKKQTNFESSKLFLSIKLIKKEK